MYLTRLDNALLLTTLKEFTLAYKRISEIGIHKSKKTDNHMIHERGLIIQMTSIVYSFKKTHLVPLGGNLAFLLPAYFNIEKHDT